MRIMHILPITLSTFAYYANYVYMLRITLSTFAYDATYAYSAVYA